MKTPREIEGILGLTPGSLVVSEVDGVLSSTPQLSPEQLATIALSETGAAYTVTVRQLRRACIASGIMPDQITAAINQIEDATERANALTDWEYASSYERGHALIAQMATMFGLSDEQVDAIFILAATY